MILDQVRGDATGLLIPAHEAALRAGGEAFLTEAFRKFGAIAPDNAVERIVRLEPCPGGSTGHKLFLTVDYARDEPGLDREMFVKFSRDFADTRRDQSRYEMASEVRFAPVSRASGFPIRVPAAYFADFHQESGTGLLITARVPFGRGAIEPQHAKCCDHQIADPLSYYRTVIAALAQLAGAHKSGRLTADIEHRFPFDPDHAGVEPIVMDETRFRTLVAECRQFAQDYPQLLPEPFRGQGIYDGILADGLRILAQQDRLRTYLLGNPDLVALCHWNAHIDNAWFWHDADGALQCGLMDWGMVSQITAGAALWGCLSAADHTMVRDDLNTLVALFVAEYRGAGGPAIAPAELKQHFLAHVALMGMARVLAIHKITLLRQPRADLFEGPRDSRLLADEAARNCLHIYTMLLHLWSRDDFAEALDLVLGERRSD